MKSSPGRSLTDDYRLGFETQESEFESVALPVEGKIPDWLRGKLLRTGPAKFEIGNEQFRHWFDGLALLHRFDIESEKIVYSSKFLRSKAYEDALKNGRICSREFATDPKMSRIRKFLSVFSTQFTDNANVNVAHFGDQFLSLTETPYMVSFNPNDLSTIGTIQYDDQLPAHTTTAHPHFDFKSERMFNLLTHMAQSSIYIIYSLSPGSRQRKQIARIPVKEPSYIHSFSMTERYFILAQHPFRVNPVELLLSGKPYIENFHWHKGRATQFLVVDKDDGKVVGSFESEPSFAFHHVNAFESGSEIIMDIAVYPDSEVVQALYLTNVRAPCSAIPSAFLKRYRINLSSKVVTSEQLSQEALELPRINYRACNTQSYNYLYGTSRNRVLGLFDQLIKINANTGSDGTWSQDDCFPGESVFVGRPGATAEDDGVLLSLILDAPRKTTFLLVLDARNMHEVARAYLPSYVPYGFHGQFTHTLEKPG